MALGPLGLTHEDLWHVTRGQLSDLIHAYNYKNYLARRERAELAVFVALYQGRKPPSIEKLCGEWEGGRVMTPEEANKYRLENIKEAGGRCQAIKRR
ncbi:hypothetical protein B5F39_11870 [Cloacibacillus sp. An23]|nr:hypothetical protein B5F39_11870 [Cloacibacillus sp. An23]